MVRLLGILKKLTTPEALSFLERAAEVPTAPYRLHPMTP